jgi:hypothetical protein
VTYANAIALLRAHPDARRCLGPDSGGRSNGFQHLAGFADGPLKAWYHWGSRSFSSWDELEGWLVRNEPPASWRDQ